MNEFDEFTGLFPVSKTLRFELRPVGKTWDNLESCNYLANDELHAEEYPKAKKILDELHRAFISRVISENNIDWSELITAYRMKMANPKDAAAKKELDRLQKEYLARISKLFTGDKDYKEMLSEKALGLAKKYLASNETEMDPASLDAFNKFSAYFIGYHEARANIYSDKKSVSVAYRIVMDNLPRFIDNSSLFDRLSEEYPEMITELSRTLEVEDVSSYFDLANYGRFITQQGIDDYNYVISGRSTETEVIKGLNGMINEASQKIEGFRRVLMKPLYKQILSTHTTKSFVPYKFNDQAEMLGAVCNFIIRCAENGTTQNIQRLFGSITEHDTSRIFIANNDITKLSNILFGNWEAIGGMLQSYKADELGNPEIKKTRTKIDKWLNSPEFDLKTITDAIKRENELDLSPLQDDITQLCGKIDEGYSALADIKAMCFDDVDDEIREQSSTKLRIMLEPYIDALRMIKIFDDDISLGLEPEFYSDIDDIRQTLEDIVPLFNRCRNYCTKKSHDDSKIKVNLEMPTVGDGWDLNKEKDNKAVILRKDDNFYLAVMNKKHVELPDAPANCESTFEKMDYKLLPAPSKMLPKVFIKSKKWQDTQGVPQDIMDGYEAGKFKKGEKFDKAFLEKLIDYYKDSISKYDSWAPFELKLRDSSEYAGIDEFYNDILEQGYSVSFRKVSSETVHKLTNEGALFLFQIYNKDFSEKTRGRPNLHTIYWKAAFSDENLARPMIKLCGQAELFFRKASISENGRTAHTQGQKLVSRRDVDNKTVPPDVYKELNRFYNGKTSELSTKAGEYVGRVKVRDAQYDIVKDRRFTVDKMFFHVPLAFNFRSKDTSKLLNSKVIDKIANDKDLKIIGLDRGERNLVHMAIIDRSGKIIEQRSLNIIDGYDYHQALDVREHVNKESRRNWATVDNIKEFKEGYISKIVGELSRYIVENNAILVMEDLNFGFKRGRFKIEKQVYQKFENMLIGKLSYMVSKDAAPGTPGSSMLGYQLARPMDDVRDNVKQNGVVFYIPAAFTSKTDPVTGFANLFNTGVIKNMTHKKEFLSKFDSITFDESKGMYAFKFDYRMFHTKTEGHRNEWVVYTNGERYIYNHTDRCYRKTVPTERISKALQEAGISVSGDLKDRICSAEGKTVEAVYGAFVDSISMRVRNDDLDYIQSPVTDQSGHFFNSEEHIEGLPYDSDANGAYNIALKGELLLRKIEEEYKPGENFSMPLISNSEWLTFIQTGKRTWKS